MDRNIRLTLEYDGSDFQGWQIQPDQRTVQGEIQARLKRLCGKPIALTASGRTDAGVHALGQVVNFHMPKAMPLDRLQQSLNGMLPADIAVHDARCVSQNFHARFDARRRRYVYRISYAKHPIGRQYAWHLRRTIDVGVMQQAADILLGRKDFTSFCVTAYEKENRICELYECRWDRHDDGLSFHIEGNRFLRAMVRSIVGTMVEMGRGVRSAESMYEILEAKNRQSAGESAPARGLLLERVFYDDCPL